MLLHFGFEWTAPSKQSMNACHSVGRPLILSISNLGNLHEFRRSKQQLLHLRVVQIGDLSLRFQCLGLKWSANLSAEMPTTAQVISFKISLASATSCSMDSSSFSSSTSSKILLSRLLKVSSFSLCCENLSCNDGSKFAIESSTRCYKHGIKNCPIIGEHIVIIFVTQLVSIATVWPAKDTLNNS